MAQRLVSSMAGDDQDYRSYTQYYENDVGEGDGSYQGGIGGYDTGGHATGGNGYAAYGTYQSSEFVPGTQVGQYADEYTGGDYYTAPNSGTGLREIGLSSIHQNASFGYDGISKVCFDSMEESIWVGSINGMIYQYIKSTMEYYSSIAAHMDGPVLCMESLGSSVASLSGEQFCVHTSGCGPRLSYLDNHGDMASFVYQKWNHKSLIGRHGGGVFLYDVVKERLGGTCPTPHGVIALSGPLSRGQIAAASPDGYLSLLDTRQGSISGNGTVADTKLYSHGFASMDSSDSLLVTAGYGGRADRPTLEPVVRVFDVRMGLRMLMALPCSNGPAVLKFHPRLASSVLICSATGMFSIMEASASAAAYDGHFVDMGGDTVASCDMSSTGHCIVFGGTNGYLHLWSAQDQPAFSQGCVVPEYASDNPHNSGIHMGDETSFSVAPMYLPPDGECASNIGEEEVMSVGLPPRVADSALMATGKISDFVTYIQNPKYDKENAPGASAAAVHALRNKRVQHKRSGKETEAAIDERAQRRAKEGEIVLPKKFRRAFIKHQTGVKFEEFDFKLFNKTPFSGLENNLANCYTNALVQVLYFTRPLRDLLVKHMPDVEDEFSLLGEMSLLFRMLDTADGEVCQVGALFFETFCSFTSRDNESFPLRLIPYINAPIMIIQAANLLRALRQTSEAVGLGILEGVKGERGAVDIAVEAQKDKSIVRRIERLNRFILTRMDKEEKQSQKPSASGASIEEIFAVHKRQKTTCLTRKELEPKEQMVQTYQVDLRYPSTFKNQDNSVVQFSELLRSSLGAVSEMKAWFDDSVRYQPVRQERMPVSLPEVMVCYTGLEDRSLIKYWDSRHGQEFPFAVSVTYDPTGGSVSCEQGRSVEDLQRKLEHVPEGSQRSIYLLTGVVSYIYDQDEAEEIGSYEGHLLAHVNVPPAYRQGKASRHIGRSSEPTLGSQLKWMTFNDFYITESSLHEVEDIYEGQKIPVLLYFTKLDYLDTNMGKELPQAAPALTDGDFFDLCRSPPIQVCCVSCFKLLLLYLTVQTNADFSCFCRDTIVILNNQNLSL